MARRLTPTTALIAANVLGFVWEIVLIGPGIIGGRGSLNRLIEAGALEPIAVRRHAEYWRLVSAAFLHGSAMHLLTNMYSLMALGPFIEAVAGWGSMLIIYGLSLFGSSLAVAYFGDPNTVTVGASGAIFGLLGALVAIGLKLGRPGMALIRANLQILLLNVAITFLLPGISRWGHIGGLIVGFVITLAIFNPRLRAMGVPSPDGVDQP